MALPVLVGEPSAAGDRSGGFLGTTRSVPEAVIQSARESNASLVRMLALFCDSPLVLVRLLTNERLSKVHSEL